MTMERGLSFGSRGPQSDFARLCWRVRIQNNNHQRHATTQGVSHAAVKHPARFRGLRAPHALYCAHQPNSAVKPTPTSSACGCPPCFALRRGLPRALAFGAFTCPPHRSCRRLSPSPKHALLGRCSAALRGCACGGPGHTVLAWLWAAGYGHTLLMQSLFGAALSSTLPLTRQSS